MEFDNGKAYDEGMQKKMQSILHAHFIEMLRSFCLNLFQSADTSKAYYDITGNTFTSYACGIYKDGLLIDMLFSADYKKPPVSVKLTKGERFAGHSYGGKFVTFSADVETDGKYGKETSLRFLRQYKPTVKKGFEIVMCTGTEYSTFLEKGKGLNVLTDTYLFSKSLFIQNLKPIQ
jgi:hypothetical protein